MLNAIFALSYVMAAIQVRRHYQTHQCEEYVICNSVTVRKVWLHNIYIRLSIAIGKRNGGERTTSEEKISRRCVEMGYSREEYDKQQNQIRVPGDREETGRLSPWCCLSA